MGYKGAMDEQKEHVLTKDFVSFSLLSLKSHSLLVIIKLNLKMMLTMLDMSNSYTEIATAISSITYGTMLNRHGGHL